MPHEHAQDMAVEQQLRQACARLDRALRGGGDLRAETLFTEFPAIASQAEMALEVIYTEFVTREELGQRPEPDEFYGRFPEWHKELREQFRIHVLLKDSRPADDDEPLPGEASNGQPPATVGPYVLLEKIAQGSMAVVYTARQQGLNRIVALKMLLPGVQASGVEQARLGTEAEAVARLQHPNIVQIFEVGESEGRLFLSLEYVNGGSLAQKLGGTPQPAANAAQLIETLARAIQYAHERGIIHRDLKPANILLKDEGGRMKDETKPSSFILHPSSFQPKITDFGLAKLLDREGTLTQTGRIFGTPSYMAPEQAEGMGKPVGAAADIYALGAILYEVLTGRPPFRAETLLTTLHQVVTDDPVPPDVLQPSVPHDLATICMKCLQKEPRRRYADAASLAEDLRRFRAGEPILARPIGLGHRAWKWAKRRPAAAALIAVLGSAACVLFFGNFWYTGRLQVEARRYRQKEAEAKAAALTAQQQEEEALRQAALFKKQFESTRRSLYTIQLAQVEAMWKADSAQALQLLEDRAHCPADLRDFAWHMFYHLCRQDRQLPSVAGGDIRALVYTADGQTLATCSQGDWGVRLWDIATLNESGYLKGHTGSIACVAAAPEGKLLATGGDDRTVRLWDLQTQQEIAAFRGHTAGVTAVRFTPDGRKLASAAQDGTIRIAEIGRRDRKIVVLKHGKPVRALAFTPDGKTLASGGDDHLVRLWDVAGVRELRVLKLEEHGMVSSLAISPDGRRLAVAGSRTPLVSLYDLAVATPQAVLRGHVDRVHTLAFSPDSLLLATGSEDRTVRLWDVDSGAELQALRGQANRVRCLSFSPDGRTLASAASEDSVRLWSMTTRTSGRSFDWEPISAADRVTALAFCPTREGEAPAEPHTAAGSRLGRSLALPSTPRAPDSVVSLSQGPLLATANHDGRIKLLDPQNFSERGTLQGHASIVWSIAFSPDGLLIATSGEDRTVRLWDRATQQELALLTVPSRVYAVAFSPDGATLAAAGEASGLYLWDVASRRELLAFETSTPLVNSIAFSADGRLLALGCGHGTVEVWDLLTGRRRATLLGHEKSVLVTAFSPDGKTLVTGGLDRTIKLWDTDKWQERTTLRWNTGYVFSAAFTPDGRTVAVGGGSRVGSFLSGEVKLYSVATGHCRATLTGQTGPITFAPDGRALATVDHFTTIKLWPAPTAGN